ncbi:MAG: DDE-type integrase/transposase/recombinase [Thermoplasmata archaeon]|nr:DDE-type integrase/transposase/recombinase [Thermoplasmata archaeon]
MLAGGEFKEATTEYSIQTFKDAQRKAEEFNIGIKEVNTDRGVQFYSNGNKPSRFERYLERQGIKFIPSRKSNPQTNGTLERLWYEYDKHRFSFDSIDEFIEWYNNRIHGALWLESGERIEKHL